MSIVFLEVHLPGFQPQLGGFVIVDRKSRRAIVRSRRSWDPSVDPDDAEVLSGTSEIIDSFFSNESFEEAIKMVLEQSNVIRATDELGIPGQTPMDVLAANLAALLLG